MICIYIEDTISLLTNIYRFNKKFVTPQIQNAIKNMS